ncbi:hypothetical protein JXO59_05635 [candidate division KSB1 bacterium]|nr:hypothetical protein [candidate division KSB1 bacterium]
MKIALMDCTVVEENGTCTYGLDMVYHSSHDRTERGLEFSEVALVDVDYRTASYLSMAQTPDTATLQQRLGTDKTRIDWELSHLEDEAVSACHHLPCSEAAGSHTSGGTPQQTL